MIPTPKQVWLVVEPIDMRAGIDGLSQRIQNTLGLSLIHISEPTRPY